MYVLYIVEHIHSKFIARHMYLYMNVCIVHPYTCELEHLGSKFIARCMYVVYSYVVVHTLLLAK